MSARTSNQSDARETAQQLDSLVAAWEVLVIPEGVVSQARQSSLY